MLPKLLLSKHFILTTGNKTKASIEPSPRPQTPVLACIPQTIQHGNYLHRLGILLPMINILGLCSGSLEILCHFTAGLWAFINGGTQHPLQILGMTTVARGREGSLKRVTAKVYQASFCGDEDYFGICCWGDDSVGKVLVVHV